MEDKKEPVKTTLTKNKTVNVETKKGGSYAYKYTELADINQYIETIGETYYQFIERIDNDDYIMTVRQKGGNETKPIRGCRIVQANLENYSNPAQEQGSALTYARRYSLLMAYGLATEDDDAQSLSKSKVENKIETKEEAEKYTLTFGKHKGKTLGEVIVSDPSYIDWLLDNEKTEEVIKKAITLITSKTKTNNEISPSDFEDKNSKEAFLKQADADGMMIQHKQIDDIEFNIHQGLAKLEDILKQYEVSSLDQLTYVQAVQVQGVLNKRRLANAKAKKEVF